MQIFVTLTGPLRQSGPAELTVPVGTTLADVCHRLADAAAGEVRRHLLTVDGEIEPSLLVAVNGMGVPPEERSRRLLVDGDDVLIMPPIAGG
jgi:sulfur carrier protein ThiS